ncbi:MAG: HPF/RaiA family ribosome-associated protein [Candidatus Acidiferrales bacterium]
MQSPLQITFRNVTPSETIEEWVRAEADKLDSFYNRVMGCRVAIEMPHRHHRRGSPYHIRIDLTVPGEEIVVKREPSISHRARQLGETEIEKHLELKTPHKNLQLAINDAFKAAGRRLQDYARRQRGDIKSHAPLQVARVSKILQGEGYGFLTSDDGRGIYFHKNSVLNRAFSRLKVGTRVSFVEEPGEKGSQASTVRILSKGRMPPPAKQAAASGD